VTTLVKYQAEVVDGISSVLTRRKPASISLVAPTGSGKTLMLARALNDAIEDGCPNTVWLWLAPYEVIVTQTKATIEREAKKLTAKSLDTERRRAGFRSGDVYLATSQLVANAASSIHKPHERDPTLAEMARAIRQQRFRLGVVLDEAHIGVDADTAFGRRIAALAPEIILAASATPQDGRLAALLTAAGSPQPRTVTISRQDVVLAGLNKQHLVAMRILADSHDAVARELGVRAMIHHAVNCRSAIEQALRRNGSDMVPLLLAQADNGEESAQKIEQALLKAGLPASCIGKYLDTDKPDGPLAEMAANPNIAAIIFKVAAGTGFDAPRACVLASDRTVQDQDTAVQFVGRIMRMPKEIRDIERANAASESDLRLLTTAFLFTRDAEGQEAFRSVATLLRALSTEIDFTEQGFEVVNAYVPSAGQPQGPGSPSGGHHGSSGAPPHTYVGPHAGPLFAFGATDDDLQKVTLAGDPGTIAGMFAALGASPGNPAIVPKKTIGPRVGGYASFEEMDADLQVQGLMAWRLRAFDGYPVSFWQEDWPLLEDHDRLMSRLSQAFRPSKEDVDALISVARGQWKGTARYENFFHEWVMDEEFTVSDLPTIARLAEQNARRHLGSLRTLSDSGAQDELLSSLRRTFVAMKLGLPEFELNVLARLAVPLAMPKLREEESVFLSKDVRVAPASKLPDVLVLPGALNKKNSPRSVYGVVPPSKEELQEAAPGLAEKLSAWDNTTFPVGGQPTKAEKVDQSLATNFSESLLIDMLDRVEGVRWWGRNPDQKDWSARVLRIDGKGRFFYPDFVVNLADQEASKMQLIETKHDTLDIEAKRRRGFTPSYGKVVFLFTDGQSLRLVAADGRPGRPIPTNDQGRLVEALKEAAVP
jgi:type III restriction enzyme